MKRALGLLIGLNLILTCYGCFVEHRNEDGRHHEEYREHEEHREGHDRGYEEHRGDERRDYNYQQ